MVRVLLVDDQELVRSGFRMLLDAQDDIEVVGEASDGDRAIEQAAALSPDVVLMDVRMPGMDGIEATRQIVAAQPAVRVLVLTTFDLDEYVYAALQAGASGFLLKDAPAAELVRGVRVVAAGDSLLAPSVTRRLVEEVAAKGGPTRKSEAVDQLTAKEREVLEHLARGLSNAEIAEAMYVGEATVKTHVGHVLTKLGVRDRVQAVVVAYEAGVVRPGDR
ncbi:MAG TPA: response regulator transcription factor [Acidimicrobiales bacterium]|nr:response regulator transcription factor [Acidimicrobiales bacterium]